ncbi:NAD-dependent malic enzyme [filamentous cyanobacterium LEGE 11480]|uniref:NAD-dependent malic enzyme n=1 Tax=Romeriopsis navalis LEGE 11480 TaxID=2777977 RepID=A0A928Z4K4_9CYAN|nr:NAD-dependent malic enzyme [Romeriopsis navalis]MBE9031864.1 NAD-dependent malic enzyme [Romeriopsis navalis LEGE 11480]
MANLLPNSSFSVLLKIQLPNRPGYLAQVIETIGQAGGNVGDITLLEQTRELCDREIVVDASSADHQQTIVGKVKALAEVKLLDWYDRTFQMHQGGKITVMTKTPLTRQSDLAMAYTPGVGRVCRAIADDPNRVFDLTVKQNMVAIVTDGSAVLGLGNLGPEGALPVMEGKAMLFKEFGGVDAFPICVQTQSTDAIVEIVKQVSPVFGGVNLEDIAAPRCFEIEARLKTELDIPIFHDDQHGTAIVVLAALTNALKFVKKALPSIKIVINGAGAAGIAVAKLLQEGGATNIWLCDSQGIVSRDRSDLNPAKQSMAVDTAGKLADAMQDADVFLGLSAPGVVSVEMVKSMAAAPIVFAMANPIPEIQPELVSDCVAVMATGRSDYPNQINNVLAFPGLFRGALDCRASDLTTRMFLAAARAIADLVPPSEIQATHIVPSAFDPAVATAVAEAVRQAAIADGVTKC